MEAARLGPQQQGCQPYCATGSPTELCKIHTPWRTSGTKSGQLYLNIPYWRFQHIGPGLGSPTLRPSQQTQTRHLAWLLPSHSRLLSAGTLLVKGSSLPGKQAIPFVNTSNNCEGFGFFFLPLGHSFVWPYSQEHFLPYYSMTCEDYMKFSWLCS